MYVHHVAITVKNLSESIKFYTEVFGFKLTKQFVRGKASIAFLSLNDFLIELYGFEAIRTESIDDRIDTIGFKHIAFAVPNLQNAIENAKKIGVIFTEPVLGGSGSWYSYGIDCNGIKVELLEVRA